MVTKRVSYDLAVGIVVTDGTDDPDVRDRFAVLRPVVGADEDADPDAIASDLIRAGARAVRTDVRRENLSPVGTENRHDIPNPLDALIRRLSESLDGERLERAVSLARSIFSDYS